MERLNKKYIINNKSLQLKKVSAMTQKSVKSNNLYRSVIQTSYDIAKAHGGEIKIDSDEGKGSEFIISQPID
jgi:hypothetical protein